MSRMDYMNIDDYLEVFEGQDREEYMPPTELIELLHLRDGDVVADIGAATGWFVDRMKHCGVCVHTLACDVREMLVDYMHEKYYCDSNTDVVKSTESDPLLPTEANRVIMINTYHHVSDRVQYFTNLRENYLSDDGLVLLVNLKMGELTYNGTRYGSKDENKVSPEECLQEMQEAGFELLSHTESLYQDNLLFGRVE